MEKMKKFISFVILMMSHSMFSFLKIVELTCKKLGLIDDQRLNLQKAKFLFGIKFCIVVFFKKKK